MKTSRRAQAVPRISDAELVVMKVIWERASVTANEVVEALERQQHWKPKTIHTLLRRLVHKGALDFDKKGREHHFRPLVNSADYTHAASCSFLSRFFDGEVAPFLAGFLERERLSRREIEELRRILDGKHK